MNLEIRTAARSSLINHNEKRDHGDKEALNRGKIFLRDGLKKDMAFIQAKAAEWRLDDESLDHGRFIVATDDKKNIVGFGRIKRYEECYELGTVGVAAERRGEGIGETIVRALIERFPTRQVWITTDLTEYFEKFGFQMRSRGPKELRDKISNNCRVKGRRNCKMMLLRK